jgi:hypothetical protein
MYETQIGRGVQVLDAYYAGRGQSNWKSMIDLSQFNIRKVDRCVLGQLFGDYYNGLDELGILVKQYVKYDLAFSLPDFGMHSYDDEGRLWDTLNEEWKEELCS